uniref:Uncharacterized protein n=1 Tax=Ignisphaera aggregans TaxID=334771 RepID=A0A7C2V9I3_9CREN
MKNMPEPEASFFRVTLLYRGNSYRLICNVDDIIDCETAECAQDLYDSYVQRYTNTISKSVITIENRKGGKIFVYRVNGDTACLCVHRPDIDCKDMCANYMK